MNQSLTTRYSKVLIKRHRLDKLLITLTYRCIKKEACYCTKEEAFKSSLWFQISQLSLRGPVMTDQVVDAIVEGDASHCVEEPDAILSQCLKKSAHAKD